jgi:hypothetical protein
MRQKAHGARVPRDLALVQVADERVGHEVVAQVAPRRCAATAWCPRRCSPRRRSVGGAREQVRHGPQGEGHGGRVAARVGDAARAAQEIAVVLGQAVRPAIVEAMIGGQIHEHGARRGRLDRGHDGGGEAVRQREKERIGGPRRQGLGAEIFDHEVRGSLGHDRGEGLTHLRARDGERELGALVADEQPHELAAHVAARPHEPDAEGLGCAHSPGSSGFSCIVACWARA